MKVERLILILKQSKLYAECPCGEEFRLSDAILFDGTKPFPPEALDYRGEMEELLKEKREELEKRRKLATEKAQITTTAVNIGKNLEKVLPILKDFRLELPDCRFLGDPIDLITFNGFSRNKITSLSFVEVKTGGARLNKHQQSIRDAVEGHKLSYRVFR